MIRVLKCKDAPASLAKGKEYNHDDVQKQLNLDQRNKCYICERCCGTDYQIDHLLCRSKHPNKTYEWSNLLLACSYCNERKQDKEVASPLAYNIEELIKQELDFGNKTASFTPSGVAINLTSELQTTLGFLSTLYNGGGKLRKTREEIFYKETADKLRAFQGIIIEYLVNPSEENKERVLAELDIHREFLGFKYWILKSNSTLFQEFEDATRWHRCTT